MNDEMIASVSVEGMNELTRDLKKIVKKYPKKADELLKKNARLTRKEVVKNVKKETKSNKESKKSLARIGSYKISQVKGYGTEKYIEISANSRHFHLVEHGHDIIMPKFHGVQGEKGKRIPNKNAGQKVGRVQGKHMMANAIKKAEKDMPETLSKMVDELLKESGF
ncbi:MAG: hypothetical protein HFJ09_05465 [Lachnospiraceae bacterium]|nr:hypothetical protein [Lachnospiraceae bacterium]